MSGWDQRGDIDDLNRRLRRERRSQHLTSVVFLLGGLANVTLAVKRGDAIQFAIGVFLIVMYAVTKR